MVFLVVSVHWSLLGVGRGLIHSGERYTAIAAADQAILPYPSLANGVLPSAT